MTYYAVPLGRSLCHVGRHVEHRADFITGNGAVEQGFIEDKDVGAAFATIVAHTADGQLTHLPHFFVEAHDGEQRINPIFDYRVLNYSRGRDRSPCYKSGYNP